MFGKLLLLAVFPIINYSFVSAQDNSCVGLKNCTLCIQNPECAWCSQTVSVLFFLHYYKYISAEKDNCLQIPDRK